MALIPEHFEDFEVGLYGGAMENQYRKMRPEVMEMPWGSIAAEVHQYPDKVIQKARRIWTMAAFQEYRTGASVMDALQQMIEVRAPIDMLAVATRFPLDEIAHVEMCGRILAEVGGAVRLLHDPKHMTAPKNPDIEPLLQCAETIIRVFGVGEAVSIPILRTSGQKATHPLVGAVLMRIAQDEAMHGQFAWFFLDWCLDAFDADEKHYLASAAREQIDTLLDAWAIFAEPNEEEITEARLGWMDPETYFSVAHESLDTAVIKPLAKRGLDPRLIRPIEGHPHPLMTS